MFDDSSFAQLALNPRAGDDKLYVEFKMHPMQNDAKSVEQNRPVYEDVEFVQIMVPGDRDVYFQPATPADKQRFRRQYEDFKAGKAESSIGTPLGLLPTITPALVEEFAFFKVKTVEGLANLSDAVAGRMPGCHEWKRKAKAFLDAAASNAPVAKVQAELEQRDVQIAQLQEQLKELAAAVAAKGKGK